MQLSLRNIDDSNLADCLALTVTEEQSKYIASNERSLAQAKEQPEVARPFAIYAADRPVGFTMFAFDPDYEDPSGRYWLWRFMIGQQFQGRGYGYAALEEIIRYFRAHGADSIRLSTKESNGRALSLYRRFGFRENGEMNGEETVLELNLEGERGI